MKRPREWWRRRRFGRITLDRCEVCGRQLRERERVEVFAADEPEMTEFGFGGGGIAATYCRDDAPQEAHR